MNIRFNIPEDIKLKIENQIKKNCNEIFMNSRLVGTKSVENWHTYLTQDKINSLDVVISESKNMINFNNLGVSQRLNHFIQELFPENKVTSTGHFHYPPTGYMGWHTNSNAPCKRLYLTWTNEGKKSFFRYLDNGEVVTDYDDVGLTARLFEVTGKEPLFWHCVGSETDRLSFGYSIQ